MKTQRLKLKIKILGQAIYTPETEVTSNQMLVEKMLQQKGSNITEGLVEKMSKRISEQYGVEKRYFTNAQQSSETLAKACLQQLPTLALENIDVLLFGSTTSSRYTGSQAAALSTMTKGQQPACYDLKAGCSTSLASLHNACNFLAAGNERVVVMTAETLSKVANPNIPETWFGLADGAAALSITTQGAPDFIIQESFFAVDGKYVDAYTVPGKLPPNIADFETQQYFMAGDGALLEEVAFQKYTQMLDYLKTQGELAEINYLIPHQVNWSLTQKVLSPYDFKGKILWDAKEIGNIGGSSVLYTLAKALQQQRFKSGEKILMMSVGGGVSFSFQIWQKC